MLRSHSIKVVTLGCSKNVVDSEKLMGQLAAGRFKVLPESHTGRADTVIINTCGFINDSKQESVDTILEYIQAKQQGIVKNVYVMGCLSERYKEPLRKEIPEVDDFFGVNDIQQILQKVGAEYRDNLLGERVLTTPNHYAYLKIAEGCDRKCSFCAIPGIRGKHISRPSEEVISEAELLADKGVKELILISQDLTYYGIDKEKKQTLTNLVTALSNLNRFDWIRLHYLYPVSFPDSLMDLMAQREDICNYIDIPLQHISDRILKSMRRGVDATGTRKLVEKFRQKLPDAALRTAFIVGYPGETDEEFNELLTFVRDTRFDRVGVFTYSHEHQTSAYRLTDSIPEDVKQHRASALMEVQQEIVQQLNDKKIGKTFKVIIDRKEGDYFIGRTESDSPEVDNEVLIHDELQLKIGEFYTVKITSAEMFDLFGTIQP